MTLVDTLKGLLMVNAYSRVLTEPKRSLYYNLIVTALSAFVGFTIGGVELLALWPHKIGAGLWPVTDFLTAHFEDLGIGIVALFVVIWFGAWLIARQREATMAPVERS